MSMSREDQRQQDPHEHPRRGGMDPEDEELIAKPVSRQDQMMRAAIAGFLGLFAVTVALAQSRQEVPVAPDLEPEPVPVPVVAQVLPPPPPPEVVEPPAPPEPPAPVVRRVSGDNRLYGRVVTTAGEEFEGYVRWDRNEGSWADLLDANKRISNRYVRGRRLSPTIAIIRSVERSRDRADRARDRADRARDRAERSRDGSERRIYVSGVTIGWNDNDFSSSVSSGIRFGHIERLEALNSRSALLTLKSGEQVQLDGNATDLGSGLRRLIIDDVDRGEVQLRWRDLDVIEFMGAPAGAKPNEQRLYGTMVTRSGMEFTGYVAWDVDEIYSTDVLDGEDDGYDREIPFGDVAVIERNSSRSARVTLKNGEEMILRGTNDVDERNSGISISDPALGQIKVRWNQFAELRFHDADSHAGFGAFDGGHRLYGTVTTLDGDEVTGYILWDRDEGNSWEMLNGRNSGVEFHVEFGQVRSIVHRSHRGATVTLLDGRILELSDSNDVNDGNRGIIVTDEDGNVTEVEWRDFEEVRFHSR